MLPEMGSGCREGSMYHHVKKLMDTVRVDEPDPSFGNMLLESLEAPRVSWPQRCSTPFRGSIAKIPTGKIC